VDDRILRVSIQIRDTLKVFEGLYLKAKGTKYANPLQDECEIQIGNLSKSDRDYLITETSPFNDNEARKLIIVEAGRVSTGYTEVFRGDITECKPSQPADIMLTMKAKTAQYLKGKAVAHTQPATASLGTIAKQAADSMGLTLQMEAKDKQIGSYSFSGAAEKQIKALQDSGGVSVYIDGNTLVVKDYNVPMTGVLAFVNADTGMIGIPEINEQGVKCTVLFDTRMTIGGAMDVTSQIYPTVNGQYCIYKLGFDLSNRDVPFYWMPEGKRLDGKTPRLNSTTAQDDAA
jgi:hypothetical protein